MWKLGEPQQLTSHHLTRIGIPVDGQPVQFDLFNGNKVASGGQLIVRLKRDPQILPLGNARYDWSLELEIPSGGLVTNNDEFMYQSPENGYQETFKFDMPKDAENWSTAINQQFYIELENGKYFGSLVVRLNTIHDTPPLGINLDIVINPNGSAKSAAVKEMYERWTVNSGQKYERISIELYAYYNDHIPSLIRIQYAIVN